MWAAFNRFELNITKAQVLSAYHSGAMDDDIAALAKVPRIARQLKKLVVRFLMERIKKMWASFINNKGH